MNDSSGLIHALADRTLSRIQRRRGLTYTVQEGKTDALDAILDCLEAGVSQRDYKAALGDLMAAPGRPATYMGTVGSGTPHPKGLCVLADGQEVLPLITSSKLAGELQPGDGVLLDRDMRAIQARDGVRPYAGEAVTYERTVGDDCAEVTSAREERHVVLVAAGLRRSIAAGEVSPGDRLIANLQQRVAFLPLARADELVHFKYLDRSPVPNIDVARDVGNANPVIDEVVSHIRQELFAPQIRRSLGLPKSSTWMLCGEPGTGKTYAVNAITSRAYALMSQYISQYTDTPIEKLPPRVIRITASETLSKWYGDTEKAYARLCDETIALARRPFRAPNGKEYMLPVIRVFEECDGIGRERGEDHITDRALNTLLERLDPARSEYEELCIIGLFTSNVPALVDGALRRRAGFRMHFFPRLTQRRAFESVFAKQLARIPLAGDAKQGQEALHREAVLTISSWLFAAADNEVLAEISYVGSAEPARKLRRDFITHALVNRAVLQAASLAASREEAGVGPKGVTVEEIRTSFDSQILSLVEQLNERNAQTHVDVPDGAHIASVRRLRPVARHQLVRNVV